MKTKTIVLQQCHGQIDLKTDKVRCNHISMTKNGSENIRLHEKYRFLNLIKINDKDFGPWKEELHRPNVLIGYFNLSDIA